ncbi:MAG: hypothetical protein ACYDH5_16190 [Acidimicrobiales bacterium]
MADHLEVLGATLAQLPTDVAGGHRVGDDPEEVTRNVIARTDPAGCTEGFVEGCRGRNVESSTAVEPDRLKDTADAR